MTRHEPDPDDALVAAWRAGDVSPGSVEEILHRVFRWVRSHSDERIAREAEDIAQDTVVRVWQNVASFQGRSEFFTWVIGFAVNVIRERYREIGATAPGSLDDVSDSEELADPQDVALSNMAAEDALATLTDHEREILLLRLNEQLTYKQIGERLGISGNAAQLTGKRALAKVAVYLREQGWAATGTPTARAATGVQR